VALVDGRRLPAGTDLVSGGSGRRSATSLTVDRVVGHGDGEVRA